MAFSDNHLFVGNYNGINFYDIDSPSKIKLKTSLLCPGGQGDVSVYGHLLFMSGEALNGRIDCGAQGIPLPPGYVPPPPPPEEAGARAPQAHREAAEAGEVRAGEGEEDARCRRPARTGSAACASSISATSAIPGRSPPCRVPRIPHSHAGSRSERQG